MDRSILEILTAAGIDLLIFIFLLIGFALYRKFRSKTVVVPLDVTQKNPFMHENSHSAMEILRMVRDLNLDDVYKGIGEWGLLYLSLHKFLIYIMSVMTLLGCGVLLIVYLNGDSSVANDFHMSGIWHIIKDPNLLIFPTVFIGIFSAVLYWFMIGFYKKIMNARTDLVVHPSQEYAIVLKGLDFSVSPLEMNGIIEKVLLEQYGHGVNSVYTIPNYREAYKKYEKLKEYQRKLMFLKYDLETKGTRTQIWGKKLTKVDGIDYYEKKIEKKQESLEALKERHKSSNSGQAIIACDSKLLVNDILLSGISHSSSTNTSAWTVKAASSPEDIIWKNFGKNKSASLAVKIIANFSFMILFLVIMTPTAFELAINSFFDLIGLEILGGFISVYFPSLLLLIYQQLILPFAIDFLVSIERHSKKHSVISSGLKKYLFYMVFYMFLYPLLGQQFIGFLNMIFNNGSEWQEEFAFKISETGQFFTIFLIHQTFMKNGWDLIVADKFFMAKARAVLASTDAEKDLAYQADPFIFDMELAISLNVLIITCSLCVVYPLILIPALSFFTLRVSLM